MHRPRKLEVGFLVTLGFFFAFTDPISVLRADTAVPENCLGAPRPIGLMDCIQTEIELLRLISQHSELLQKIEESAPDLQPPPPASQETDAPALERVAWFDENLEVYAIIGDADGLIAHARLGPREYRLRTGDAVRLARVLDVHDRGIDLLVSGLEISIGLSGRKAVEAASE